MKTVHHADKDKKRKIQKEITKYLKNENRIVFAYIHGSFLEKGFKDIDIGIYVNVDFKKKQTINYELHLEAELNRMFSYQFDVRVLNYAPLSFKFNVIKKSILLFSKDENKRTDFECLSMVKYHDFDIYRKMYLRDGFGIKV